MVDTLVDRMQRALQRLSGFTVERAKARGYLHDGGGLYLQVTVVQAGGAISKSWAFRYSSPLEGKGRRYMGLGPYPSVSLAAARKLAADARSLVQAGKDPIDERDAETERQRLERARGLTFDQAAEQFIGGHEGTWRNEKHRQQWRNTLKTYASPTIGATSIAEVTTSDVVGVLQPIWTTKPETASRLRGRIERIWGWARVKGCCAGENPARWRDHLDKVFPPRAKVRKVKHHAAVAVDDMPAVYQRLCKANGIAALAARFTILTAARVGETTGATTLELKPDIWSIPAERMKADRDHNVPLSQEARDVLNEAAQMRTNDRLFSGHRQGRPLSHTAVIKALRAAGAGNATTHGCRSTFKDWATERTSFSGQVSEMALAHSIEDKVEAAYRRGELIAKRTMLMDQWAAFVTGRQAESVVVQLHPAAIDARSAA
jgi:integrase